MERPVRFCALAVLISLAAPQKLPVPPCHLQVSLSHSWAGNASLTLEEPHLKDLALLVHMSNVLESLNSA